MDKVPRFMIAAPSSGAGKTTVTMALLTALKAGGLDPVSFKCGPDYIDSHVPPRRPGYSVL